MAGIRSREGGERVPVRTSPDTLLTCPKEAQLLVQAPLAIAQGRLPIQPPAPPRVGGLQPAPLVELDAPVGVGCAWAKMGAVLVSHEGL